MKEEITYDVFDKVDIRLGTVVSVKKFCPKVFLALTIFYFFAITDAISAAAIRLDSSALIVPLLS